jgi:transcriptional regulator with XRE-family HTH domain
MAFGSTIKKLREEANISVEKLAAKIGVNSSRWRKWEEKDFDPRDEDAALIEEFFGMKLQDISSLSSIREFLKVPDSASDATVDMSALIRNKILIGEMKGVVEPTPMQILDRLAKAFEDQAAAFRAQAEMMKNIEKKMAQESTQAKIEDTVNKLEGKIAEMQPNLTRTLTAAERIVLVQDRDHKEVKNLISQLTEQIHPSEGQGKAKRRTGANGKK